jgi:hypothetical protein
MKFRIIDSVIKLYHHLNKSKDDILTLLDFCKLKLVLLSVFSTWYNLIVNVKIIDEGFNIKFNIKMCINSIRKDLCENVTFKNAKHVT